MPAPDRLTHAQISHVRELIRYAKEVSIEGYDLANYLVVRRVDKNGSKRYSIRPDGSGRPVLEPCLEFTDLDLFNFPFHQEEFIRTLII